MKRNNTLSKAIQLVLLTYFVTSKFKWTAVFINTAFTIEAPEDKTSAATIQKKNYSLARNMFKDLRQFKAYLRAIDNFDQSYIVQQGGVI